MTRGTDAYVYGPGGMVLERVSQAGEATFQWQDAVGSVIGGTSAGGSSTTLGYDVWGQRTGGDASQVGVLGFAGQVTEPSTDLIYMRARSYDPKTAQFLTRDALEEQTGQPYLYAAGNPTLYADPSGLAPSAIEKFFAGLGRGASMGLWDGGSGYDPCSWWSFGGEVAAPVPPVAKGVSVLARARAFGSERVTRVMSRAELDATLESGLVRGGRRGKHYVTNAASRRSKRARQRLSLPDSPEVRVQLEVGRGVFGRARSARRVKPANGGLGGGRERTARGRVPCSVVKTDEMC